MSLRKHHLHSPPFSFSFNSLVVIFILDTNAHRSYDRDEHSDVMIEIKGSYNNGSWDHTSIHAHQCILEARSAYFHRELRLPKYAVRHHADRTILLCLLIFT